MSDFISKTAADSRLQLVATALVSGAVVACSILGYQHFQMEQMEERTSRLKESIPSLQDSDAAGQKLTNYGTATPKSHSTVPLDKEDAHNQALAARAQAGDFDDDLILEQLARNRVFLTPTGLDKLRKSFVIVVGCGGVGSHCTATLARSGVQKLRIIDFDLVTLSSLNRHAVATLADVGTPKVDCLQRRIIAITPWTKFDTQMEKFDAMSASKLLAPWVEEGDCGGQKPDFVVDAIDNIDTKVALLKYCHDHNIPVISSMGAGCKSDPTRIFVADIGVSTDDGLSRACRKRLKLAGITHGIPVVYSQEKGGEGKAELLPLPEEEYKKGSVGDLGVLPDFRVRILPVLGTMPAVFGYTAANHVILSIAGYPLDYRPGKGREKMYDGIQAFVQVSEERIAKKLNPEEPNIQLGFKTPITTGDVAALVDDIFRGRSVVSGLATRLVLIRWRRPQENTVVKLGSQKASAVRFADLVCMTKEEAARHEKEVLLGEMEIEDLYGEEVVEKVQKALSEAGELEKYR